MRVVKKYFSIIALALIFIASLTDCGHTKDEDIHIADLWSEWEITATPTCEATGIQTRVNKNDSSLIETHIVEPLGHDWDSGYPIVWDYTG